MVSEETRQVSAADDAAWNAERPEARQALINLAQYLGRVSARAMAEANLRADIDDPEVAREMLQITFDAVFLSGSRRRSRARIARLAGDNKKEAVAPSEPTEADARAGLDRQKKPSKKKGGSPGRAPSSC